MKVCVKECKSIITKSKLPDADFVINPYIGCCHGCIYCYAQFMSRFTGHVNEVWGSFMDVKTGGKLNTKNMEGKTILFGSVTDPYNPLEKIHFATQKILKQLIEQNTVANIEILTKSPLVLRDIELLKQIPNIRVGISLSTMDSLFAKRIEKNAALPVERIKTIQELHRNGIPVYVFVSPIFPYFADWKNVIDAVGSDADMICFENLNLRANYRTDVFNMIQEHYPEKYESFKSLFEAAKDLRTYWEQEAKSIEAYVKEIPHKLYFFHEEIKKE